MKRKLKVIDDPKGQWNHPGEITRIPSGDITMKGVNYPVLGVDNLGNKQMMLPGAEYTFPGNSVTEYPQNQGWLDGYQKGGSYSDSLALYKAYQYQKNNTIKSAHDMEQLKKYGLVEDWKKNIGTQDFTAKAKSNRGYYHPEEDDNWDPIDPTTHDSQIINYYKSLNLGKDTRIGMHSSPDVWSKNINPIGRYYDGQAYSPIYKKPVGSKEDPTSIPKVPVDVSIAPTAPTPYYGININNGIPSPIIPQLELVPVYDPGLAGLPQPVQQPVQTYTPPTTPAQVAQGYGLYDQSGKPIQRKGKPVVPAQYQYPGGYAIYYKSIGLDENGNPIPKTDLASQKYGGWLKNYK